MIDIASILEGDDRAFIVGGQAINLWAEHYAPRAKALDAYRPFTSKDLDYFGQRAVAEKLAKGLGGSLRVPDPTDTTFQTVIVKARVHGIDVGIDFLSHVKGVRRGLEEGVVDLFVPYHTQEGEAELGIRLMHPLHCLQSRIANIVALGRVDDTARRQARAAPIILREFIVDALEDGDHRAATDTLRGLYTFLSSIEGRETHLHIDQDPIDILRDFCDDQRLDERYRTLTLAPMIARLERRRTTLGRALDRIAAWRERTFRDPA